MHRLNECEGTSECERGQKRGESKAVGRSHGGLNTKIHAIVDGLGNPVEFLLSPGNDHDSTHAIEILSKVELADSNVIGDRAYGTQDIRDYITRNNAVLHHSAQNQH